MTMKTPAKLTAVTVSSLLILGLGNVAAFADTLSTVGPSVRPPLVKPIPRPHVHGTIESINSSLLTLKAADKTVNVKLSSSTVYDRGPAQTLTLSDLKAGAEINVEGAWENGTFNALRVHLEPLHRDGLPGRPGKRPDGLGGIIQSVAGQSLTLKAPDGRTFTVALTGSTKLHSGPQTSSTSALQAGKEVHIRLVSGEQVPPPSTSSNQTVSNLKAADVDLVPPHWDGTITGVQGTSVTLETKDGQKMTLNLSSATIITYGPQSSSSQLAVGMKVHVEGTANGSTISPARIDVHP